METKEKNPAAVALGSVRSERKRAAALENLARRTPEQLGQRPPKPITEIPCGVKVGKAAGSPCGCASDSLEGHHWSCLRGAAILRRRRLGLDVQTGLKP